MPPMTSRRPGARDTTTGSRQLNIDDAVQSVCVQDDVSVDPSNRGSVTTSSAPEDDDDAAAPVAYRRSFLMKNAVSCGRGDGAGEPGSTSAPPRSAAAAAAAALMGRVGMRWMEDVGVERYYCVQPALKRRVVI